MISEILESRAKEQGERPAYVFLSHGETGVVEERLTYAELDARARSIGASLAAAGAGGERVALLLPPGPDFVASFFGCLYAGAVAVPALPPRPRGADPRLSAICRDARPRVALAAADKLPALESAAAGIPELAAALRMAPATEGAAGWRRPDLTPDSLAFLQYTSGSTSSPKGVMVSHGNLLHNEELIRRTFEQSADSVVLGWLPLYHDMGLIGTVLQPLYTGAVCYLMTPGAFLQRPARWLEAISRYRATTSGGPNFAYELCVRKVGAAERESLDLSSWQVAFNGAEPVRAGTLRRFAAAFAPCGFRAEAFRPCYGLAEATLLVSGWREEGEPRVRALDAEALERHEAEEAENTARSRELVGCGAAMQEVLAVDPESGEPCSPGGVGEIWVAGPSVARGYWERPEETAATFGARLADGTGPFLRTGDLGFVSGGELFLTGRLKDLIILRGRNHYPQDLELTAERSHDSLRAGGGAAFAVDVFEGAGEERLVIVHEVERHARAGLEGEKTEEIAAAVRRGVAEEHEVSVAEVVLIRPETLPRTSSGKVRRSACRELYLQGGLRVLGASRLSPAAADEDPRSGSPVGSPDWLRRAFAAAARVDPNRVDPDLPLSASGLDSLAAVELKQAVEEAAGVSLPLADLLEGMTLRDLERRLAGGGAAVAAERSPGTGEAAGEHPTSWNQRSLWFLHLLAPESSAYNIAGAARLGPVSPEALGAALQGLVDRHPMLRATFADTPEGPVQRVAERAEAAFDVVDATGWSDAEVHARLHAEAYRPFDLAAGPLLRAVLLRRGGEAFLVLAVHHVAADFRSMAVLARELGALAAGEAPPPPAALYTDFARRQERMLASPAGEGLWEHWRERLAGAPPLDLPTDQPRRPVQALRGGSRTLPPSPEREEAVRRLAAAHGCTPFVALLAAWQAVLSRWSGQEDFLAGAPMAGRSAREWSEVIGYFVNLVPLRADLSGGPAAGELVARTRGAVLDALAHQDLPFALLAERLQPERDPSRPPLVAALLNYEKAPAPELAALAAFAVGVPGARLDLGGLTLESIPLAPPAAQLDLSLTAAELPGGLAVSLQWDADLFDATTAGRMLDQVDRLLAAMAADPRPVAELPLLGDAERHQVLAEWNDTAVPPSPGLLVHDLFEAQAARTPDAPAVVFDEEALTYAELCARAAQLARHLRRMGCGPESRVGVALERSLDLPVALLGVLQAGAAYVPLDPDYPRERLAYVLEDAAPQVLITQTRLREALPPAPGTAVLCLDGEAPAGGPPGDPVPADDRQLAYVLYTSGSTGRPKGVGVPHRALVNFLASMRRAPGFSPGERLLAVTSLSFDIAALEILLPLTVGGCVELASREEAADGALLAARLRASAATVLQATPATWRMLLDAGWPGGPDLRALCGGEAMPRDLAASLAGRTRELWNLYGPTETTVWSSAARVRPGEGGPISIGRPIAGTQIHLLDRRLQAVPLGVPGELWIGGAGLARGYLGRPDLTAERFLPDPFAAEPGGRLYRTGDLARHLPGGRLEVLGRIDHQVKIRGHRIELGEIEAALAALPGVRQAVVVVRSDGSDGSVGSVGSSPDPRLVAYVVGDASAEELRRSLRERLPEPMVPAAFVTLPALPLTPNGKVDRKALPAPQWQPGEEGHVAPRTPVEEVLAGIWAEVLGLERVGAADHFFELGGHSLLATRVMSRLRGALGVEVPLRELFAAPRLADFAARVEAARRSGAVPAAPPLVAVPREGDLPLSFAQQRLWFIDQLEPGSPLYNMPGALRVEGPLDGAVLARCLGEIVRRHEALRTVFVAPEGSPVQVIQPAQPFVLPVIDLSALPGLSDPSDLKARQVRALLREEAARPFDLARGPLLRGLLLRLAEGDHFVALTQHHIASDGWSSGVLVREIAALYPALAAGRPSPLPELPVQAADFAVWQRSWLHGEVLESEIAFWRRQLAGLPPLLELPTDRPRPAAQSHRGATRPVRLPAGLVRQMETLARREGATLFLVLLAGFQTLLARSSGQDDLAVGSPVAGRNRVEIEGLIGFFVNNLVLRGDLAGAPTFRELLGRVRETALAAWLHQDVPFEKLVDELAPERNLAHAPLFQAMLVLQNAPAATLEIEGLRLRPVDVDAATAKLDLTLTFEERDGGLAGTVEYATDLFDAPTIDRLAAAFERLLAAAVAAPERGVFELPLLGEAERQQILVEWNDTSLPLDGALVHAAISRRAGLSPEALAVAWDGGELTYGELERRSNQLARHLRRLGVGPEVFVGLCCDRSGDLVVGVLGILKAGGAYVPLDPEYPQERLRHTLADCGAPVLVAQERTGSLAAATGARLVAIDGEPALGLEEDGPVPPAALPENPAYAIYTSGSTGRPKGVVVTHGALANSTRARLAFYRAPVEAYMLASSFAFDSSVAGLFWTLRDGGTLVLHREQSRLNLPDFLDTLARRRASHLLCLSSLYSLILENAEPGQLASLKTVIVGGDACPPALVAQHAAQLPTVALVNEYGPTEGTVWSSAWSLTGAPPNRVVPIGRPIANVRLYLLDRGLEAAPAGVHGELWIGGASLARGYLGRPDLTAERFLPDPFSEVPGARMYRTGDRVRWLADGSLDFLGRVDHQVKVRGFRVELGEIEAALLALPGVREAVVVAQSDGSDRSDRSVGSPGHLRLVAYVTGDADIEELRRSLRERLPDSMVPAAFVKLAALPLTANGKVDRKALPAPELSVEREGYVAPRTREEEILAAVWAQVLRRPRVGVDDNFFELGGDSIVSVQIVARARQAGLAFTVKQIFEHPTVAGLARHATVLETPSGLPRASEEIYPLTPLQSGMLFHGLMAPESGVYVNQVTCTLPADLDTGRFRQAWERLVERHGVLRTAFLWEGLDEPRQAVRESVSLPWQELDWRGLPAEEQERRFQSLRRSERHTPLPLHSAPLMRFSLVRLDRELGFVWTFHHLLLDGWSQPLLVRELEAVYTALAEGREPALPPVRPFSDYVAWLEEQDAAGAEPFWRGELAGFTAPNRLGIDRPAGEDGASGEAEHGFDLSREVTAELQALAARHHVTLQTVTLGAWALLVSRYSGEEDVVFGSTVSGRPADLPGVETMVGLFINTLPVRVGVDGAEPLGAWLRGLQERQLARQDFAHTPLARIQRWSEVPAGSPLFETLYVFENYPDAGDVGSGRLRIGDLRSLESTNYPVTLELAAGDRLSLRLTADRARIDGMAAPRLLRHLDTLLAGMAEGPERNVRRVGELGLLSPAERHQVMAEWNDTLQEPLDGALVHEAISRRAELSAEALAVGWDGGELTYGELERRSNRLARHLRRLGVGPEVFVGLCCDRSGDLVVGVLGILKAGGAYVPLDPEYPQERLRHMLADCGAPVLVAQERTGGLAAAAGARLVAIDAEPALGLEEDGPVPPAALPENPAYLIYTSGSTGRPKGVVVTHGALARSTRARLDFYRAPVEAYLLASSFAFDSSVAGLFWTLQDGGTLVLHKDQFQLDLPEFLATLARRRASHLLCLPSLYSLILEHAEASQLASLSTVIVAGEACPPALVARHAARLPGVALVNEYGPTEGTVWSSACALEPSRAVSIGRPIGNVRLYVLDRGLDAVPAGVPGELFLGGASLARGYLGRPDLTAERFLPDPFSEVPGARMYRTGDRVRWLPDGTLDFLGRVDHQVKVRGFRVELGEIEAALLALPGVREAVVVVRSDGSDRSDRSVGSPGHQRLVAYVAGDAAAEELRRALRERLPDSMVPAAFVKLVALPLTANGKVDRKALPAPELSGEREGHVAPRTREEEVLAAVWAQVLGLPRVGVNDSFFELGGDSILSVQIVARARQAGLHVTVRQIFQHQTIAELARHATVAESHGPSRAGQGPVAGEVPLTPIQQWFFEQGFADPHHWNQALLLEPREPLAPAALERALAAVVEHHDALRMRFDGRRQENAAAEPATPFHQVDLSGLPEARREEAFERAAAELQAGFDLAAGPLTRLCHFAAGAGPRLLWAAHHLVVDGVSWRVLVEDLEGAYRQAARGQKPALPPKTTSFQEWARRRAGHAGSEELARELDHWRETARIPVPPLPVDFPSGGDRVGDEATVTFELGVEETTELLQTLPAVYHSRIDEALLSALARAFAGWTGSPRLRVDLEGHGREPLFDDLDLTRTVGWFTSHHPVVLEAGDAGPGEALVSAKERLREVPGRGIGYGLLRAAGLLEEAAPAEVLFNYLGQAGSGEGSLFRASTDSDSTGPCKSPRARRTHLLEVAGMVTEGRLRMILTYGSRTHHRETAERLAAAYAGALRELIRHARESEPVFTPSDFPKARLGWHGLRRLESLVPDLADIADVYPLSPAQNGILFHTLMAPESGVYVTQVACTLPEDLDAGLFRQAWERLAGRHEALRTAFLFDDLDEPLQVVLRQVHLPWQDLDWRGLAAEEQERRFESLREGERHAPLSLTRAPLMRFSLIRLDGELRFLWTSHHLLLDGWSLPLLVRELGAVYSALREGREPMGPILPPARPFSDYVVWLRKQDLSRAEPFWREELAGVTAPNSLGILGADHPAERAAGAAGHDLRLSREVTAELQALAARHRLTLQTLTQGAWAVLLNRYSGDADVVFGGVVSGRPAALPGVETMVGMFVNTLPVRVRVNGAEPLAPWLRQLQDRQLARQELEHTPLAQIQRWSEVPAGSPLFETLYVFENYPDAEGAGSGGLGIRDLRSVESTNYPLSLALTAGDRISLHLTSDRARVDGDAAGRLLQHLATLLAGMAEGPDARVGELDLLTTPERRQILEEWNDTRVEGLAEGCLHRAVAAQAARTPSAVAVELGSERWTYRRLVGSARLLARHLRELGVGPDEIVGLCADRSPAMVVGMLAILEAGGAWLPLDPTYPPERLAFMLDDSGARVLLLQEHLRERLGAAADDLHVVPLDARWSSDEEMAEPLGVEVTPDHLAYVIYTSGSTGRPKGVMVPHRGICNRLGWAQRLYRLDERDGVLQKASFGFDFSVWECFAPLWAGGRLVLAEPGRQGDVPYLVQVLREHRVTFVHFVPSMLAAFLAEEGVETCGALRQVFSGGEALTPELRDRALARLSRLPAAFDNEYGPTETSVDSTQWACAPGQDPRRVPIGRPISNTRVYVADRELRPVPAGVAGELLVGGAGVTRGYLRRPELTAERFIPDPFGQVPGARLYRTGDLARWLPDGSLDFLGRLDHQVKLRGLRIELGEIEAALAALPAVRQAVVVVRSDGSDRSDRSVGSPGARLVAYVVGDATADELRRSLRERLPDYMVPAVFVALPALPLTASGKVDRKALPAPEQPGAREEAYVAPRTREEEILAAVWAQVLRLPRVGVEDNFFELGGDSILSLQIVARARQAGLVFTVREIFEHQTVAGLALHATAAEAAGSALAGQGPVTGEVPLTPIQSRFFDLGLADPHHWNQALRLEAREPLSPAALDRALAAVVAHHDALRMRFDVREGDRRQENAAAEPATPFHQVDLAGLPASRLDEAFERAAAALQAGFDLAAGPLTRLALFDAGAEKPQRLLWVTHHLVVDGVSWRVLLEDFEAAYRESPLPPKTTSFKEWARRLARHAEALSGELGYWREAARASVPRLPVDFPGDGGNLTGDQAAVGFELGAEETSDLLQTLPSVYHSRIDDALLSSLVRALAGWTGSPRLRVDLEGHGREPLFDDLDVSRTVGWFTAMHPVVLEGGDADPGAALVSAKERLRAVPGRGIGYGLLRAAGLLEEGPPAEVLFNYLGQADATSGELALFRASTEGTGPCRSPRARRAHLLEVAGLVAEGRLRVTLTYGSRIHRRETVERLATAYAAALRELLQHGRESEEVFTPSDFGKARLDAKSFAKVAALLADDDED